MNLRSTSRRRAARSSQGSCRHAFTLVELLVVIGIIALLISILLPTLSRVRKQAALVKCASNMRQVANAFFLYAQENKGMFPVVKDELTANERYVQNGVTVSSLYWFDFIGKYVSKGKFGQAGSAGNTNQTVNSQAITNTVIWGCTEWDGSVASTASWNGANVNGRDVSLYENGYTMNIFPTYRADRKLTGICVPGSEWAIDSPTENTAGRWYSQTAWTRPAERALVVESTLWHLAVYQAGPGVKILPQVVGRLTPPSTAGFCNIDRYRHGTKPKTANTLNGLTYSDKEPQRVAFNIAYADGHVATCRDIKDGYKAVVMKEPGVN